ncbi:unnamed protein product [Owenia fusiformis]|uniref:Uncharacterized protein n=1 Tax=Owenia fusiformis TaxID=6347 RepID=A0A8J1Y429_OWEFU|nr:unnamed protein product [Owenia fusiformis]
MTRGVYILYAFAVTNLLTYVQAAVQCGATLSVASGAITSPCAGNPGHTYEHEANCEWTINAASGLSVHLTFSIFDVEYHSKCEYDYVEVYDDQRLIGRYCGTTLPPLLISSSNRMRVVFHSDRSVSKKGFHASYITSYPTDCSGEQTFTGVKIIQPTGHGSFSVYCSKGCVYLARRFDGSVEFYRKWVDYQNGFGNKAGEHFIGLENLVALLKQRKYKLRVDLTMWPPKSKTGYAEYSNFDVGGSNTNYSLTVGGYSGTAGDSLHGHNGAQFSTYDRDNDATVDSVNCAVANKGAWWYQACPSANLFGSYPDSHVCPQSGTCISWAQWYLEYIGRNPHLYSFRKVDMSICPI